MGKGTPRSFYSLKNPTIIIARLTAIRKGFDMMGWLPKVESASYPSKKVLKENFLLMT